MNAPPEGAFGEGSPYRPSQNVDVVVFPTFLDIEHSRTAGIATGGQNGHPEPTGAHTGDISMPMLRHAGCTYVLCGHSERRQDHAETDDMVAIQASAAIVAGLHPIVCIGETSEERDAGKEQSVVERQWHAVMTALETAACLDAPLSIAYEPVWAIGTGKTATPVIAQDMHAYIRSLLPAPIRGTTRILYGGSMKPDNAEDLLAQPDIDGGLIGGASLKPDQFAAIVAIAEKMAKGN